MINAAWHKAHRMPRNATAAERLCWHLEHEKECGCRPMPARLAAMREEEVNQRERRKRSAAIRSK
jgi:hypothetical protein